MGSNVPFSSSNVNSNVPLSLPRGGKGLLLAMPSIGAKKTRVSKSSLQLSQDQLFTGPSYSYYPRCVHVIKEITKTCVKQVFAPPRGT